MTPEEHKQSILAEYKTRLESAGTYIPRKQLKRLALARYYKSVTTEMAINSIFTTMYADCLRDLMVYGQSYLGIFDDHPWCRRVDPQGTSPIFDIKGVQEQINNTYKMIEVKSD